MTRSHAIRIFICTFLLSLSAILLIALAPKAKPAAALAPKVIAETQEQEPFEDALIHRNEGAELQPQIFYFD